MITYTTMQSYTTYIHIHILCIHQLELVWGPSFFQREKVYDFLNGRLGRWLQSQHGWDMWDIRQ